MLSRFLPLTIVSLLVACAPAKKPVLHATDPIVLSAWSLMSREGDRVVLHDQVLPYRLNSTLFSDYAHKLRTVTIPVGTSAVVNDDGSLDFPLGTIISKTFFYPKHFDPKQDSMVSKEVDEGQYLEATRELDLSKVRLLETRLLVRRSNGWAALPYVWNDAQTEANLEPAGDLKQLSLVSNHETVEFPYLVPDQNQCAGCHGTDTKSKGVNPIGPTITNLNRPGFDGVNQLGAWRDMGWLNLTDEVEGYSALANWRNTSEPLPQRARAYLDVNCGHCHSETGPADTSGLFLDASTRDPVRLGRCKLPIAAGQGTGGHPYSIVPGHADQSILVYRMISSDPGAMMPELGRSLSHKEGIELISAWINTMSGSCGLDQS